MQRCHRHSVVKVAVILIVLQLPPIAHADDVDTYNALLEQFHSQYAAGNYREAELTGKRKLSLAVTSLQDQPAVIKEAMLQLANVYTAQARFDDASELYEAAVKFVENAFGRQHPQFASCLITYGNMRYQQERYADAESLVLQGTRIAFRNYGAQHSLVAVGQRILADIYTATGQYNDAENLYKQALETFIRLDGIENDLVSETYLNRATLYFYQGRYEEAVAQSRRAAEIIEKMYGPQHPSLAGLYSNLGNAYRTQNRLDDAEKAYNIAAAIAEKNLGKNHPTVANIAGNLSNLYLARKNFTEAKKYIDRSLAIYEATFGPESSASAEALYNLASWYDEQQKYDDAIAVINRALSLKQRAALPPGSYIGEYFLLSQIHWKTGKKDAALAGLERVVTMAEEERGRSSGAEAERAESFARYTHMFETLVRWQLEMENVEGAFQTIERSRARSLLEEMNRSKVDLDAGRSPEQRAALRERETQLRRKVAELERQLESATSGKDKSEANATRVREALEKARDELYDHYRDERRSNPIYRDMITRKTTLATFDDVRKKLLRADDLALIYLFGNDSGYVLALTLDQAKLVPLTLDENSAKTLGTSAGPLTSPRLRQILMGKTNDGIVPQLAKRPEKADAPENLNLISRLEALFSVLVPPAERTNLTNGKLKRLIVIPDGTLAMFPFETLVVRGGQNPEYLLDVGPAILYGPSASVLCNLIERPVTAAGKRPPVLTVADPVYPQENANPSDARSTSEIGPLSSGSRYAGLGGHLARLPFTGIETAALVEAFKKVGIDLGQLKRELATEANVRFNVSGRKIIHLACHGLADQAYANFFGALALTPGNQGAANPADDGFLTLREIYELKLNGCELAILSACETNYGPQQQGEGTWALSRGFLVAGARRVIASNWLVDDEAAANLIGLLSTELAPSQKQGDQVDYATQLQVAKKWVRDQNRWKSPYYWSSLVLVGPP